MATTYRIAEVARRTGFSPATLRYYEEIGLLGPVERTHAGYRAYDDAALRQLVFIGRVKALGCSLREIAELTRSWAAGRCEPVQRQLQQVLDDKIGDAQMRVGELTDLTAELRHVRAGLGAHTPDGPCDDACGCANPDAHIDRSREEAIACSLDPGDIPDRVSAWQDVLGSADRRIQIDGGVRIELADARSVPEVVRLAIAEQRCCRFFRFNLTVDERGIALEVRAPAEAANLLTAVFGQPAPSADLGSS